MIRTSLACRPRGGVSTLADVLVVDDDPAIRTLLQLIVRRAGFQCDTACDGKEAIDLMTANNYKVAIIDLMMPRVNGYEVLEHLGHFLRRPAVIVATAMGGAYVRDLDGRVVHSIVRKPFDLELMTALITDLVRSMSSTIDQNDETIPLSHRIF
jgi:DNA-binding response OmpR family regulator